MPHPVLILNGPNLNLLGHREPEVYGTETLEDIIARCTRLAEELDLTLSATQSNHEGALVEAIHAARDHQQAIVINPAAYTHTSVAIRDALAMFDGPVIEVHISNVHTREAFRHHSFVSGIATAVIAGCGSHGYDLALRHVAKLLDS